MLLAADAAGAVLAGILLEGWNVIRSTAKAAMILAGVWACALLGFASSGSFALAIALLMIAGFLRTVVQHHRAGLGAVERAARDRGRVVGLYNMAGLGMRAFSGLSVGLLGAWIGIHWSLGLSAFGVLFLLLIVYHFTVGKAPAKSEA